MDNKSGKLRNMTALYLRCNGGMVLLYRVGSRVVGNSYTGMAGGHFEQDELNDARACVLRELREETGLTEADVENLSMRYVTLRLKNGEIRQNYYFFEQLAPGAALPERCDEGRLEWAPYGELLEREMPVTAHHVLRHYLETGRYDDTLYAGATVPGGMVFTPLTEF